jgi:hypothetical protein
VAVDAEEGRRRREDNLVEIRKNRREESLQKKRREGLQAQQIPESANSTLVEKKLEHLPALVTGIWTDDNNMQFEATTQFRKLLSIERSPPIEEVIQAGVVPRFIEFLMREDFPQLQFEAAWALTNIASGTSDNTKVVIDSGAVPIFVKLLASPSDDVREQVCIYTLYHIVLLFLSINKVYMFSSFLLGVTILFVLIKLSGRLFCLTRQLTCSL